LIEINLLKNITKMDKYDNFYAIFGDFYAKIAPNAKTTCRTASEQVSHLAVFVCNRVR
jgi:hypothetical protein